MHDLNFFEGHVQKRELKLDQRTIYLSLFGIMSLFLAGYIIYNSLAIRKEIKVVSHLKQVVENPDTVRKIEEIQEEEMKLNELKESVDKIKILDSTVAERNKIDEILLEKINHNMPNSIFMTSLSIQKEEIHIVGISEDKWSIAEFQKNLESLEDYDEIFVSHISLEEDYYNFALDMALKIEEEDEQEVVADEGTNQE